MPQWVRVHAKGVGKWTAPSTAPLGEGAEVIDEPATDDGGNPLPDEPDPPTVRADIVTDAPWGVEPTPSPKSRRPASAKAGE
jgi:hypothetical protein